MSEELIKRLRTVARDEERAWGDEDEIVILLREAADALESSPAPVQAAEGWRLVPITLTRDMVAYAVDEAFGGAIEDASVINDIWVALLAAAPSAPVAREEGKAVYQLECKMRGYTYWIDCDQKAYETEKKAGGPCRVLYTAAPAVDAEWLADKLHTELFGRSPLVLKSAMAEVLRRALLTPAIASIPPGMYQDPEGKIPAQIGDPVALVIQELPEFMRQPAPTAPAVDEERGSGWIPVGERRPGVGVVVLGFWKNSAGPHSHITGQNYGITARNEHGLWYDASEDDNEDDEWMRPDYWQPLPPPPAIANQEAQDETR